MRTPEAFEKDDIKKYLTSIGAWYFMPLMAGYGKSGVSDIVACIDGTFWGIEVKRPGKDPTAIQERRMTEVRAAGGMAAWGIAKKVIAEIDAWRLSEAAATIHEE